MRTYIKFIGVALAMIMAFGFVACNKGSDVKLSCDSNEIKKAFEKHRYIEELKMVRTNVTFGEISQQYMGTSGWDPGENVLLCEVEMKSQIKSKKLTQTLSFTAEYFKGGGIAFYDWDLY